MIKSWRHCLGLLYLGYPIARVYRELADLLGLTELKSLADVIGAAAETGANLPQVFTRAAQCLRERLDSVALLEASLASRRFEGTLLAIAPAAYTAFLRVGTPDYMAPLYTGKGRLVALTVFLLQFGGSLAFFRALSRERTDSGDLDLASFQEDIALHFEAGLSLPQAWQRATRGRAGEEDAADVQADGLRARLLIVAGQLAMGLPFGAALEKIPRLKGGDDGLGRLVDLLRQNYHLGADSMARLLRIEATDLRRRVELRTRAYDSKRQTVLLFPMILLLLSALILTAAPALLSFK